jgi:hypothetical protein
MGSFATNAWLLDQQYNDKMRAVADARKTRTFEQLTPQEVAQWQQQWGTGSVMPDMATQKTAWTGQRDYQAANLAKGSMYNPTPAPAPTTNAMSMPSQTPTTGSQPATPASPWDTQPKPMQPTAGTKRAGDMGYKPQPMQPAQPDHFGYGETRLPGNSATPEQLAALNAQYGTQQTSGTGTNAFQLPQGFNIRTGSTDPNDPTGQNAQVYGTNYFPGGLPGFETITNAAQFNALSPDQQGSYREALYLANQRAHGQGPQVGGVVPPLPGDPVGQPGYTPGQATPGVTPGGPPPPAQQPPPPAAPPGGGQTQPTNQQYQFPNNFSFPAFSYNQVEDYKQNPAYQSQLKDSERALNRRLLSMGRSDSTGGINAFATNQRQLGAEFEQKAYERAVTEDNNAYGRAREQNMTEFDRANQVNKLLYDRDYQERVLSYDQKFRENERQYGRAKAEEQLAYDRQWNEDAREYSYWKYLVDVGLRAAGAPSA